MRFFDKLTHTERYPPCPQESPVEPQKRPPETSLPGIIELAVVDLGALATFRTMG